jgi:uncharacterized repeat protein (TIGR03806 family)
MGPARFLRRILIAAVVAGLAGCQPPPEVRFHSADAYPERLSDWGLILRRDDRLVLGRGVRPYEINTPLFSDYALKLRTVYLPPGAAMTYHDDASFEFPVGSIVSKTFFYPRGGETPAAGSNRLVRAVPGWDGDVENMDLGRQELLETRLLVRQADGWDALPYVWSEGDAFLEVTGDLMSLRVNLADGTAPEDFAYVVPSRSECAGCHATNHSEGALQLIGVKARHLTRAYPGRTDNQLAVWADQAILDGLPPLQAVPQAAVWNDATAPLGDRARAYLDSNCGHCHNPAGAADTSGLWLDANSRNHRQRGFCKPPVAAGRGTGGRPYSVVPGRPDASILVYRTETRDPATRMPETGRALTHSEGVALLQDWISSLPGTCVDASPRAAATRSREGRQRQS